LDLRREKRFRFIVPYSVVRRTVLVFLSLTLYYLSRRLTEVPVIKEDWVCEKNEAKLAHFAKKTAHIT